MTEPIDELHAAVRGSKKYAAISDDLIRTVGARELAARKSLKDAIKATKNKLHQVAGAYLDARPPYERWHEQLAAPPADLRPRCRDWMRAHASTRERLPILEMFYATTLASIAPVRSVLDVACGLNPLALQWMPLADDATYHACDLYADMMAFLNDFFAAAGVKGTAEICDLIGGAPRVKADVALVLKTLPVLEQVAKDAGRELLRALDAPHLLVTFPTRSLGGRGKGMGAHYEAQFRALAADEKWAIERFEFPGELAFLVRK